MSTQTPMRWDEALVHCRTRMEPCVLATVLGTSGSTPRDVGAKCVITRAALHDSIGGGGLEYLVTAAAREMLTEEDPAQRIEHFPLGQAAGQCCGGAVAVLLEPITPTVAPLALFGAGHVGRALVRILGELPFHVIWIDARRSEFPEVVPSNVDMRVAADPLAEIERLPSDLPALVMTHDHDLDRRLVAALLRRSDSAFVGLIASEVKAARFRMRLAAEGIDEDRLAGLASPVGLPDIPGKEPMAVAVSIAAQLLGTLRSRRAPRVAGSQAGIAWHELRALQEPSRG